MDDFEYVDDTELDDEEDENESEDYEEDYDEEDDIDEELEGETVEETSNDSDPEEYVEYAINENGEVQDYLVSGAEACKVWAILALNIEQSAFEIFSDNYGCSLQELMSESIDRDIFESEAERMIDECLKQNKYINGIKNFSVDYSDDGYSAKISFTIKTVFGDEEVEDVEI